MSGGVAWVLDLKEQRVNTELVELGPVEGEAAAELEQLVRDARRGDRLRGRRGAAGRLAGRRWPGSPR